MLHNILENLTPLKHHPLHYCRKYKNFYNNVVDDTVIHLKNDHIYWYQIKLFGSEFPDMVLFVIDNELHRSELLKVLKYYR